MRHRTRSLSLPAAILVIALLTTAGCSSTVSSAINSVKSHLPTSASTTSRPTTGPDSPTVTTAPPTTAPPTTAPPTTVAPTTAAPTTAPPTRPPVTITTVTSPSASATPASGSAASHLLWLWILLGVLILAGLIALIVHSASRRSAAAANWRSRVVDAYARGSALHDAMSVAEAPGALVAGDAGARWADIQRRADDLTQTLYALREQVPDPDQQARIEDVLVSLQAVRSAMDAERIPGGAGPQQAEVVRGRLLAFESSLRALRDPSQF